MDNIRYFKQDTVDFLKGAIQENLSWYRDEEDAVAPAIIEEYEKMRLVSDHSCFDTLNQNADEKKDIENVLSIYTAFNNLSLQQATEERIWVYMTHVLARQYTSKRWNKIPSDDEKATKYILLHYFASNARGLIRDNAVSRLWWMGHLVSRCSNYDLEKALCALLKVPDVRANLLERSSLSMSKEIISGVLRVLILSSENDNNLTIYERENFRLFMKMLNQRGGRIMLNTLNEPQLSNILDEMVKKIIGK